jgi:tripartite-type tricarboxylate transporter receptor subunit TctC
VVRRGTPLARNSAPRLQAAIEPDIREAQRGAAIQLPNNRRPVLSQGLELQGDMMSLRLLSPMAALACTFAVTSAGAQSFPTRPVHIVVPYAAGGAVDALARTIGQALTKAWGQQPVIENRPGAGGIIASQALTQAEPDGHTLILVASGHVLNQFFYQKLPYDTFKDFTPISEVAYAPNVIVVGKDNPATNLQELLAAAKAKPSSVSYGISGIGTSAHLAGELLNHMANVKLVAVPYKGGAPAIMAVIAGDIPMSINPMAEVVGQLEGGGVRAIAVTTAKRSPTLPDVPTVAESGVSGYDTAVWWGFLGPAGMRGDLTEKIYKDLTVALNDQAVVDYLRKTGSIPVGRSPKEFEDYMHAEADKWAPVIKATNIALQ